MGVSIQDLERVVNDFQAFATRSTVEISQLRAEVNSIPQDSGQTTNLNSQLGQNIDRKV